MGPSTGEIVREIARLRMDMEVKVAVLRQHVQAFERLYEKLPDPVTRDVVDRGGPAGRVDH